MFVLQVCKKGNALTPEQASILKLLGIQIAKFKVIIKCYWTKGKGFHKVVDSSDNEVEKDEADVLEDESMEEDET